MSSSYALEALDALDTLSVLTCEQMVRKTKKEKNKKTLSKTNILDMIFLVLFDPVFENKKVSPAKQPEKKITIDGKPLITWRFKLPGNPG